MSDESAQPSSAMLELIDRAEITDLISRFGACLDEGRFDQLDDVLAEDITGDLFGGRPIVGRAELVADTRAALGRWERNQHVITNVIVELDGDEASVRARLISTHVEVAAQPTSFRQTGSSCEFGVRRTRGGWRISSAALHELWGAESPARDWA